MFKFDQFLEVWSMVNSRNFNLKISEKEVECLVPFADMINDRQAPKDKTKWWYDNMRCGFILTAQDIIEPE
jgi:hypothetical protein